jgi:hypothetical protein
MEKRNSGRHKTDQPVVCEHFNSHSSNHTVDGRMKNYGNSGMYVELLRRFKEGTILVVRTAVSPTGGLPEKIEVGFRAFSLVEVKWSQPLSVNGAGCYGTGLKHLIDW